MTLWRVLPWNPSAKATDPGGALWVPRELQGAGRHDAPDLYGCLYLSEDPVAAVAEALAPFRGTGAFGGELLQRSGRPLALAELELAGGSPTVDLDDPAVLAAENLKPSTVATGHREVTQAWAARLFESEPEIAGIRWWSVLEAGWLHLTLFDRAIDSLTVAKVTELTIESEAVVDAAKFLGLA